VHTFDQNESLGKPLLGSIATHMVLAGIFIGLNFLHFTNNWGSPTASSGSVGVTMIKTIPIQRHEGPQNPLANNTTNIVPQETMPVKVKPEVQAPDPKAVELQGKVEKPKKVTPKPVPPASMFKAQSYQPNQVYATTPQSVSSPMYGIQGAGGIEIGASSVLGSRFGAYVNLMREQISQHWNRADLRARSTDRCAVSFLIARNGSVNNVQISHPSGNVLLDNSARRAIIDANPLPTLPREYPGNDVTVELWFQLTQ
jgi:TonB family protein